MDRVQALDSLIQNHSIVTKLLPCLPKHLPFGWPQKRNGFTRKKERSFILTASDSGQYPALTKKTLGSNVRVKRPVQEHRKTTLQITTITTKFEPRPLDVESNTWVKH